MLEATERDAVHGDLIEARETGPQALRDVLGLAVRRQAALWKDWQPWFAMLFVVFPLGMFLSRFSSRLADQSAVPIWLYANNWDWNLLDNPAFQRDFPPIAGGILLSWLTLMFGSAIAGLVVGVLSRRTIFINSVLLLLVLFLTEPWAGELVPMATTPRSLHSHFTGCCFHLLCRCSWSHFHCCLG